MSKAPYALSPLKAAHDRSLFRSGAEQLDHYLRTQVAQDIRRRIAACFVALGEKDRIIGYYTLASASVPLTALPPERRKKLPRYPAVPTVRMGRLAVDQAFQGTGLGGILLADAIDRTVRSEIASYALIVDAKSDDAAAFYRHHGFISLPDTPLMLFLPLPQQQDGGSRAGGAGSEDGAGGRAAAFVDAGNEQQGHGLHADKRGGHSRRGVFQRHQRKPDAADRTEDAADQQELDRAGRGAHVRCYGL